MKRGVIFVAAFLAFVPLSGAQTARTVITPSPAIGAEIAEIARLSGQMAEGQLSGGGRWLRMTYESSVPLDGFVVPMRGTAYNPVDMLRFDLPPSEASTVEIDLSVSPSWNVAEKTYMLSFSSPATDLPPAVTGVEIVPATAADSIGAFLRHVAAPEDFVISTYHMLRGYRVLGVSLLPSLAALLLACCVGAFAWKRLRRAEIFLVIALCAQLFYGARIGVDLLRLSATHATQWFDERLYGEAGSTYDLAEIVPSDARLAVCFDSTDYFAKLLRYLLLPIPVQIGSNGDLLPTHVAVIRKIAWSYDNGILKCGPIDAPATLVREFPDGSRLFSLTTP